MSNSKRLFPATLILLSALCLAVFSPAATFAQATDPLSLLNALNTASNAGDVETATALFADDAVVKVTNGTFSGKAEIRKWREAAKADGDQAKVVGPSKVEGNKLTTVLSVFNNPIKAAGVDFLELNLEVIAENGKIKSMTATPTPATLPKLQKLAAAANSAPGLPASGSGGATASSLPDNLPLVLILTLIGLLSFALFSLRKVRLAKTR